MVPEYVQLISDLGVCEMPSNNADLFWTSLKVHTIVDVQILSEKASRQNGVKTVKLMFMTIEFHNMQTPTFELGELSCSNDATLESNRHWAEDVMMKF